jgi:inosose dehydratase
VALNPLAWIVGEQGVTPLDRFRLPEILWHVRTAGFAAVMAEVPPAVHVAEYRAVLAQAGLRPAPGYFAAAFEDSAVLPGIVDDARRCARQHAQLGLTEVFVAGTMVPHRLVRPAVGALSDLDLLAAFTANLATVAAAMADEGVRACLHPHVGSLVETEREIRFVLDRTDPDVVRFGPDTGHLFWAGMDPASVIGAYAERVGAVHLKDVHLEVVTRSIEDRVDYRQATFGRHLWTEPGRGDADLTGVIDVLGDFEGWWIVEVDRPDRLSPAQSASFCADWATEHLIMRTAQGVA